MAAMNNWLGFSLSPHEEVQTSQEISSGQCFDLPSDSSLPSLNLPAPFGIFEAFNRNHQSQEWNSDPNYKSTSEMSMLMGSSCSSQVHLENQEAPKLENFLGIGDQQNKNSSNEGDYSMYSNASLMSHHQQSEASNINNGGSNTNIGLSMIKSWLRNNPSTTPVISQGQDNGDAHVGVGGKNNAQSLSLSMSTGAGSGGGGGENSSSSENNKQQEIVSSNTVDGTTEAVPRKSIDTFGQRTSIYRGVTRHRWTGRYEAHLWDNSCRREGQTRKGRQVYLGGYDKEDKAARSYDLAALKYWGPTTTTNFPISNYEKELEEMKHMTRQEYVASLRRKSSGFSRGASIYRGVTRHHQHGRWQARIGRVAGNKDLYLGTFSTQEEAAEAYDIAAIKFRGLNAVTNFEINRYDVKSILESSTLPIGGAAKRLKDAEMALDNYQRANQESITSHLTNVTAAYGAAAWPNIAFPQAVQPLSMHYPAYNQQRLWCKQEQDSDHHMTTHNFQDYHQQLQLGSAAHNFLQPTASALHNLMSLDSSSIEQNNVSYQGVGYASGFVLPHLNSSLLAQESNSHQSQTANGYGETEVKQQLGSDNTFGSNTDPYHGRSFYYHTQQSSPTKAGQYDHQQESANGNNWMSTAVPVLASRNNTMAVCHGAAPTFTVWNDT